MSFPLNARRRASLLVAAAAIVVSGCVAQEANSFGDAAHSFLTNCSGVAGTTEPQCECIYGEIQKAMTFDEFKKLDERLQDHPDEVPDQIVGFASKCENASSTSTSSG